MIWGIKQLSFLELLVSSNKSKSKSKSKSKTTHKSIAELDSESPAKSIIESSNEGEDVRRIQTNLYNQVLVIFF